MAFRLFIIFTVVPIIELYLIIEIGGEIGALNTIIIIIATALLGSYLAKREGFIVLRKIQSALNEGRMPGKELIDGLLILIGGFTLLTPGFLTDLLGLSLLFPVTRAIYTNIAGKIIRHKVETGEWKIFF